MHMYLKKQLMQHKIGCKLTQKKSMLPNRISKLEIEFCFIKKKILNDI